MTQDFQGLHKLNSENKSLPFSTSSASTRFQFDQFIDKQENPSKLTGFLIDVGLSFVT